MNSELEDRQLKQQFQALQKQAEHIAPSFNKAWNSALVVYKDRQSSRRMPWFVVASSVTIASVIMITWLYLIPVPPYPHFDENGFTWWEWQSPTDVLLEHSGQDLFGNLRDHVSPTDFLNTKMQYRPLPSVRRPL